MSVVAGDLGVSPGTSITGITAGMVSGTTHSADATSSQAQTDITTAYDDAAGRDCDTNMTGQDLGGRTLIPGVYCFDSSAQLTGTLTLNGGGDPDAVFIFQIESTLTTASSSIVNLINSAQNCNVYWKVGSSATLGTTTKFKGNILAMASITVNTGATVDGRAFARSGAVTLDANTISKATCTTPTSTPTAGPSPTITPTPTAGPSPTSTPTAGPSPTITPTPTSGPSPTPTPTPTSTSSSSSSTGAGVEVKYCPHLKNGVVPPIIIESKRIDKDSVYIKWAPYSGVETFNVEYGFENGKFLYNTNVTGFFVTINDLPINQPIWIRVAARNDCMIGTYGESKFAGSPKLPNTGFAPQIF